MRKTVWNDETDGIATLLLYFFKWSLLALGITGVASIIIMIVVGIAKIIQIGFR